MNSALIVRPRIVASLHEALQGPVALILAPAGFGKSVALRHALEHQETPYICYGLRADNATFGGFVRGLCEALAPIAPLLPRTLDGAFGAAMREERPALALAEWLCAHMDQCAGIIAIDDFQIAAETRDACDLLIEVIARKRGPITWLISARGAGLLPVERWRADGHVRRILEASDLALSREEAGEVAAARCSATCSGETVDTLYALTRGYPTAFRFACDLWLQCGVPVQTAVETREMTFRFLAEQVFAGLTQQERDFLLAVCVYPHLDITALAASGHADCARTVRQLSHKSSFLSLTPGGGFRIHDLFREYLEYELRAQGDAAFGRNLCAAAAALEQAGDAGAALLCYIRARALEPIAELLSRHGFELIDHGKLDIVERALATLDATQLQLPQVLALNAVLECRRGRFESAEASFDRALALATDPLTNALVAYHFARMFNYRDGVRVAALLEAHVLDQSLPSDLQALIGSLYASATAGNARENTHAADAMQRALNIVAKLGSDETSATVFSRAAMMAYSVMDHREAERLAACAAQAANAAGCLRTAASAYGCLAAVAAAQDDDLTRCRALLASMEDAALRAGDVDYRYAALTLQATIESHRADLAALAAVDERLKAIGRKIAVSTECALAEARALRAAWSGDFESSHAVLATANLSGQTARFRAIHMARVALHAAAAGKRKAAQAALIEAHGEIERFPASYVAQPAFVEATLACALALLLLGKTHLSEKALQRVEDVKRSLPKRWRVFLKAVSAYCAHAQTGLEGAAFRSACAQLRAHDYGGYALLLEQLPLQSVSAGATTLTEAEMNVLGDLARGMTSRAIAANSGRKKSTVDGHVTFICRKLGAHSRRDAVAIARKRGLVR